MKKYKGKKAVMILVALLLCFVTIALITTMVRPVSDTFLMVEMGAVWIVFFLIHYLDRILILLAIKDKDKALTRKVVILINGSFALFVAIAVLGYMHFYTSGNYIYIIVVGFIIYLLLSSWTDKHMDKIQKE